MGSGNSKIRALSIILLPVLISGFVTTSLIIYQTASQLRLQSEQFGKAAAGYLALSVRDHLISNDLLGLNVLLSGLLDEKHFDFASVYNSSNELLAQAGRRGTQTQVFTQQVTFQNASAGHVQIAINEQVIRSQIRDTLIISVSVHATIAFLLIVAGWLYGDMIYLWIMHPVKRDGRVHTGHTATRQADEQDGGQTTVLVLKIRPGRLLLDHRARIHQALALHAGEVSTAESDDIVICYRNSDQLFQAICSGLLVLAMFREASPKITIKAGMHQVQDHSNTEDFEKVKKHASYLASISDNQLLASRAVHDLIANSNHYECQPFHSSMTPDGEVFMVDALSNQDLIESQAKQLA